MIKVTEGGKKQITVPLGSARIGDYSDEWDMSQFTDYKGSLTIQNGVGFPKLMISDKGKVMLFRESGAGTVICEVEL